MKKQIIWLSIFLGLAIGTQAQGLSPMMGVSTTGTVNELNEKIKTELKAANFDVIGSYKVANNENMQVICFTREDLKTTTSFFEDRGALAAILKIGIRKDSNKVELSLLHPNYMFYAYFGKDYDSKASALKKIDQDAKNILSSYGDLKGFGGQLNKEELEKYHYKMMMPYFEDPIGLEEYDSFEKGLAFIRERIAKSDNSIESVYELVIPEKQTAIFGIGLKDPETGEASFMPIIGESHLAAMPYEIILQGDVVTMLHGKYRFALYWPELSMGEFMKIMSTPGDVEDAMEKLTEIDW